MKAEHFKGIAWGVAGLAAAYLVYRAAQYIKTMPSIGDALAAAGNDAAATLAALPATVSNAVSDAARNINVSLGLPSLFGGDPAATSGAGAGARYGAGVVNFTVWPASVKSAIDTIKKRRGERVSTNSNDYLGWRVYQDGTFTSPAGEYFIDQVMRAVWDGRSLEGIGSMEFSGIGRIDDGGFLPDSVANFWDWKPVYQQPGGWPSVNDIPY